MTLRLILGVIVYLCLSLSESPIITPTAKPDIRQNIKSINITYPPNTRDLCANFYNLCNSGTLFRYLSYLQQSPCTPRQLNAHIQHYYNSPLAFLSLPYYIIGLVAVTSVISSSDGVKSAYFKNINLS